MPNCEEAEGKLKRKGKERHVKSERKKREFGSCQRVKKFVAQRGGESFEVVVGIEHRSKENQLQETRFTGKHTK